MSSLIETLNQTREETLDAHYRAAVAELTQKIKDTPLGTTFQVYCCSDKVIAEEVTRRFNAGGVKTECVSGMRSTYLSINLDLPLSLSGKKEEEKQDEKDQEQTEADNPEQENVE